MSPQPDPTTPPPVTQWLESRIAYHRRIVAENHYTSGNDGLRDKHEQMAEVLEEELRLVDRRPRVTPQPSIPDRLFDAIYAERNLREEAGNVLLRAMGCDPEDTTTWPPFNDFAFDPYDSSWEMLGVEDLTFTLDNAAQERLREAGFGYGWINYTDGSERHLWSGGLSYKAPAETFNVPGQGRSKPAERQTQATAPPPAVTLICTGCGAPFVGIKTCLRCGTERHNARPEATAPPEGPTTALTDSVNDLRLGDEVCHRNYPTKRGVVFKIGTDFVRVRWSDGQIGDLVWRRDVAHSAFNLDPLRRDPAPSARPDAAPHTCMGGDPGSSLNGPCRACDLERGESR